MVSDNEFRARSRPTLSQSAASSRGAAVSKYSQRLPMVSMTGQRAHCAVRLRVGTQRINMISTVMKNAMAYWRAGVWRSLISPPESAAFCAWA